MRHMTRNIVPCHSPRRNVAVNSFTAFCALLCIAMLAGCTEANTPVERKLVGTWEIQVPTANGSSLWVWDIRANGTYGFHAEGPGNAPAHSGAFLASNGRYAINSTAGMEWQDTGTYKLTDENTLVASSSKLGPGTWHRRGSDPASEPGTPAAKPESNTTPIVDAFHSILDSEAAYQRYMHAGVPDKSTKLSHHFWMTDFDEQGIPDDHNHRSNIDGTSFATNSRNMVFIAKTDLKMTQLPKFDQIRCGAGVSPAAARVFEITWLERGNSVEIHGSLDAPPSGSWAAGNYTFSCETNGESFLEWKFKIE